MLKKTTPYAVSILIALGVGGLSALITGGGTDLYNTIVTPPLSPAPILFPIVWSILYILMGIGSAVIWKKCGENVEDFRCALRIYALQLVVNFLWSVIFFNLRTFMFAFIWLVMLWILICMMIFEFAKISRAAAYMQIPYLLWVAFAGYLNLMIYFLNR